MKTTAKLTLSSGREVEVTVSVRESTDHRVVGNWSRMHFSIASEVEVAELGEHPPYSTKGEDPENDRAWRRYNRAELQLDREIAGKLYALSGGTFDGWFSRTAGCSCQCSPGFVLRNDKGRTFWVDVKLPKTD